MTTSYIMLYFTTNIATLFSSQIIFGIGVGLNVRLNLYYFSILFHQEQLGTTIQREKA